MTDLRVRALTLAHDHTASPQEVVDRAQTYLGFLRSEPAAGGIPDLAPPDGRPISDTENLQG